VIRSFYDKDTERLANGDPVRRFSSFERVARRRLSQLNNARSLQDLKGVGASLEALRDDRTGQHSIRISGAWRLCFVWNEGHAERVEIVNYH